MRALDDALSETLTNDYWTQTLVSALETQKARSPAALAFRAAQVVLGTRALFSDQSLRNLFNPPAQGLRAASEVHHLFPEAWLHSRGIRDRRLVNQVANLADTGWHENSAIGARGPADYVPRLREKLNIDDHRWGRLCAEHALPLGWESMEYEEFLRERRRRMADIIRVAFRQLGGEPDAPPVTPPWFLPGAELCGKGSQRQSVLCVRLSVRFTSHDSAIRRRRESKRQCLRANAKRSHGTLQGVPRVRSRSALSTTSTSDS